MRTILTKAGDGESLTRRIPIGGRCSGSYSSIDLTENRASGSWFDRKGEEGYALSRSDRTTQSIRRSEFGSTFAENANGKAKTSIASDREDRKLSPISWPRIARPKG